MKKICCAWALLLLFPLSVIAETIYLLDGKIVRGTILSEDDNNVYVETGDSWQRIAKSTIQPFTKAEAIQDGKGSESNSKSEVIFRLGVSQGTHNYAANPALGGGAFSDTVNNAKTITGEYFYYVAKNIGLGAGVTGEFAELSSLNAAFNFVDTYVAFKVRSTPVRNRYYFLAGQYGYGSLFGDSSYDFKERAVTHSGGEYLGIGMGAVIKDVIIEGDYSRNAGSLKSIPVSTRGEVGEYKIQYSRINISVGVLFR
jgi:hypothetical protein